MADRKVWQCQDCGSVDFTDEDDGFRYCGQCGSKAAEFVDTGDAEEDFVPLTGLYSAAHSRHPRTDLSAEFKPEPIPQSQFWSALTLGDGDDGARTPTGIKAETWDGLGPTEPQDFGGFGKAAPSFEDYHNEVRIRYVMGLQLMVELQCEALVKELNVSPLVCGLAGTLWLRFVAATRVFDDGWVDEAINESESQALEEPPEGFKRCRKYSAEPRNMYGQRAVMIWLRSLKKTIPLSHTLAVSFLACHLAREPVLATDIERWSIEGKLPYFSAFVEVEKSIGGPSKACPMSSNLMFRPDRSATAQKLESAATSIAETIGLALPPVNFYAIALRYLRKLCIPLDDILPHALRLYEWSMPSELWLSSNEWRLPTRVGVMAILIVAIRIRYNIHGFGAWEKSFTSSSKPKGTEESKAKPDQDMEYHVRNDLPRDPDDSGTNLVKKPELSTAELLRNLEASYNEIAENYEYSKDMPAYLQFCEDVAFAGLEPSFEDHEERKLIDKLWNIYQSDFKDSKAIDRQEADRGTAVMLKRARTDEGCGGSAPEDEDENDNEMCIDDDDDTSYYSRGENRDTNNDQSNDKISKDDETPKLLKDEAVRKLKLDMEENRFCYIPPRVILRKLDYLHYVRKRSDGTMTFVAHADYYVLLRACAKVAEIEIRLMHMGVLGLERRLDWIEQRIKRCLHLEIPSFSCEFCGLGNASVESLGLSDLNL